MCLERHDSLSNSRLPGGSWYSGGLSRSIARLSPDRDVELMTKLVLGTTPFSKKFMLDVQNYSVELKQIGELKDKSSIPT